jgi:hypothetical protein
MQVTGRARGKSGYNGFHLIYLNMSRFKTNPNVTASKKTSNLMATHFLPIASPPANASS